jgi:RNA polymerase sigma-70 factor (ECF subfamily)
MGKRDANATPRESAEAFEALVRHWQGPVTRLLCRLVCRPENVPDLCQEVFLRVHRGWDRFRGQAALSTWLYRIALNVARDAGRRRRPEFVSLNGQEAGSAATVDRQCSDRETAQIVLRAVQELPEPLREALVLRHYEQMSFEEMARITGTPASTLKSRFSAALQRLKDRLQQLGFGPEEIA